LLFKTPKGHESEAQITAFEDTWHWGEQAEEEFRELRRQPSTDVAQMMQALRDFLGENDMMAYLTMMANRLLEMHRVLKPTGSLYLHCDPTASHYLKIVLDGVFGKENFRNEIIWKRASPKRLASLESNSRHVIVLLEERRVYLEYSILQLR
jgi:site-specific DNA-methyltransferase (adenine-specific)